MEIIKNMKQIWLMSFLGGPGGPYVRLFNQANKVTLIVC